MNWNSNYINRAAMYVDNERPETVNRLHLLREELTQSLGLVRDSDKFFDSIFQSSYRKGTATKYSEYDKAVIRLLYHPDMEVGLNEEQVHQVLTSNISEVIR